MRKIEFLVPAIILIIITTAKAQEKTFKIKEWIGNARETFYVKDKQTKIKHGSYLYEYGKKIIINGQYDCGERHGNWHYKIGKNFTINSFFKNGLRDSIWTFYENGKLISEVRYVNGKRNGNAIGYGKNGEKLSLVPFKNSNIDGTKYVFYESGKTKFEVEYKNDSLDGNLKYYNPDGNLILHLIYKKNNPYSLEILDLPDSIKYFSGNLKDGNGLIKIFSKKLETDSLFLISEQNYKNGQLDGLCSEYELNGNLKFQGCYKEGFMVGQWNFYDTKNSRIIASNAYDFRHKIKTDSTNLYPIKLTKIGLLRLKSPEFFNKEKDGFRTYVANTLKYPENALQSNIQGRVYIQFDINETGKVFNVKPLNKVDKDLTKEAMRIIQSSPYWIPGLVDFIPSNVRFTFPITFVTENTF